jgi:hypothetical protein
MVGAALGRSYFSDQLPLVWYARLLARSSANVGRANRANAGATFSGLSTYKKPPEGGFLFEMQVI